MRMPIPAAENPLRIAAVPSGHPYARNLFDPAGEASERVVLLPDPRPAGAAAGQWWPPVMLDPQWIRANRESFDLLHLHFGTESFTLSHLEQVLDALRAANRPLVFTVHDLTNPQLVDQAPHLAQLGLLVGAADEVITLTAGAAAEVGARWGRDATVIAHPQLAPVGVQQRLALAGMPHAIRADATGPARARAQQRAAAPDDRASARRITVGLHLRDLRPNIDALGTVETLLAAVAVLREGGLDLAVVVDLNERVRDENLRSMLRTRLAGAPGVELREHPRLSDDELADALWNVDIEVLPYRHGTHSGWLELCFDLGVAVAAPDIGFYAEQHTGREEVASFRAGSRESLVRALLQLAGPIEAAGGAGAGHVAASGDAAGGDAAGGDAAGGDAAAGDAVGGDAAGSEGRASRRSRLVRERAAWRVTQQRDIHRAHLAVYRRALAAVAV